MNGLKFSTLPCRPLAVALVATLVMGGVVYWLRDPTPVVLGSHRQGSGGIDPETSCGPVSLAVISHYLGNPGTISEFHEAARCGELGTCSMADLLRVSREHGFCSAAVKYDPRRPPNHQLPLILHADGNHFFVGLPAGREVVVIDPPSLPQKLPWNQLPRSWEGVALVVGRSESDLRLALVQDGFDKH